MSNGIGSVWAVNFGEEGRPNGVGPVWIANASAFSGGGGEFPASAEQACSLVETNSATWNGVSGKLDTTAFSDVSGTFLTAHQDLSDYATTAQVDGLSGDVISVSSTVNSNSASWGAGVTYTSPSGTILISDDKLEGTNSAVTYGMAWHNWARAFVWPDGWGITNKPGYPYDKVYASLGNVGTDSGELTAYYSNSLTAQFTFTGGGPKEIGYLSGYPLQKVKWSTDRVNLSGFSGSVFELASVDSLTSKQDALTFTYNDSNEISAINSSAIAGADTEVYPISGTGAVDVYEQNNILWVSGKDFTSDIGYISGAVGDVETLLASL